MKNLNFQPSWKQLSSSPDTLEKWTVLNYCGIDDDRAFSNCLDLRGAIGKVYRDPDGQFTWIWERSGGGWTTQFIDPTDFLKRHKLSKGIPSGDLARRWFRRWGWLPRSEQPQPEPTANTRTII